MHQFEHLFGRSLVEIARRLIGNQDRRIRSDGPSDGNALFLPTRELAREMVYTFGETDDLQRGFGMTAPFFP